MKPHKLKRCPVCGKRPKIKVEHFGSEPNDVIIGATCKIWCKSFFGKKHLSVYEAIGRDAPDQVLELAMREWNRRASVGQS